MQRHYIMVGPDGCHLSHESLTCVRSFTSSSVVPQYYEMSYGLNIEMHKQVTAAVAQSPSAAQSCRSDCCSSSPQAEIVKRLNGICTQVLPYLSQEVSASLRPVRCSPWLLWRVCGITCCLCLQHQQQVMGAIDRAKQVTPPEMNSIIRVSPQSDAF